MADRFPASIEISGCLPDCFLSQLHGAAQDDGASFEWGDAVPTQDELAEALAGGETLFLCNDEVAGGTLTSLTLVCRQIGLSYQHHNDARYEFEAELTWWSPGMPEPYSVSSDQQGHALISLQELKELRQNAPDAEDFAASFDAFLLRQEAPESGPLTLLTGPAAAEAIVARLRQGQVEDVDDLDLLIEGLEHYRAEGVPVPPLRPEDLAPLLTSSDAQVRQRAILLVPQLEAPVAAPKKRAPRRAKQR